MISTILLVIACPAPQETATLLRPVAVVGEDGVLHEGWEVVIHGGIIEAVGPDLKIPAGGRSVRLGGILAPGFVDAWSWSGCDAAAESLRLSPDLLAAEGVDSDSDVWEDRLKAGVTTVQLLPRPTNTLSGWAAVAASSGPDDGAPQIVETRSRQAVSLIPGRIADDRKGPLGLPGALDDLAGNLQAVDGVGDAGVLALVEDAAGVDGFRSVGAGLPRAFVALGDPGIYGGILAGDLVALPVPGDSDWNPRGLEVWRRLHEAGARIAFGTGNQSPERLRFAAMAFSRATGDPSAALASITSTAAAVAGRSDLGRIRAGARADLVLWNAHPLDASAGIIGVMTGGRMTQAKR